MWVTLHSEPVDGPNIHSIFAYDIYKVMVSLKWKELPGGDHIKGEEMEPHFYKRDWPVKS